MMGDCDIGNAGGSAVTSEPVAFRLGTTPVRGRLVLAPLSGYNDQPFRRLCRRLGAALVYTGLLASKTMVMGAGPLGTPRTTAMLRFHPEEQPLVAQIFGSDVDGLVIAASKIADLNVAMIDVNLGCAKPKVVKIGAGAALLRKPAKIARIFDRLSHAIPIPVSGKIRLGWDADSRNYLEVARAMADHGAALIAVHARTAAQGYHGRADWDAIAEIKAAVELPVLGSGDVKVPSDIERMRMQTGCDGIMIGRAALGHPWIFQRRRRGEVPWSERQPVILEHLEMMIDFHGPYHGIRRFRKHLRAYLQDLDIVRSRRQALMRCDDPTHLARMVKQLPLSLNEEESVFSANQESK